MQICLVWLQEQHIRREDLSEGDIFPTVVQAYLRRTRIVRGKDVDDGRVVDETAFTTNEEKALWNTVLSLENKIHPDPYKDADHRLIGLAYSSDDLACTTRDRIDGPQRADIEVDEFISLSSALVEPLEDFFNNVFVRVDDQRIRKNRLSLMTRIADLRKGIADLAFLPGF